MSKWQPIETAPRDGRLIIGWCVHAADRYFIPETNGLTTYGAHVEGLSRAEDGPHILKWGGELDDPDDGYIPPWWFEAYSEWEIAANPTHWIPLPAAPKEGE